MKLFVEQDQDGRPFPAEAVRDVWSFLENVPERYDVAVARPAWNNQDYKGCSVTVVLNGSTVRFNPIDPGALMQFPNAMERMFAHADSNFSKNK